MGKVRALKNVKSVELVGLPRLTKCVLLTAFRAVKELKMKNAGKLEENEVLREVKRRREVEKEKEKEEEKRRKEEEKRKKKEEKQREEEEKRKEELQIAKNVLTVTNKGEFSYANCYRVGVMVVSDHCCNERGFIELDLTEFVNLRELNVGDECFEYVREVKLIGLKKLERVVIGQNCFTEEKNGWGDDPNRHFYLKNCERLRELKMGRYSFSDYSVCEIENVPSLEVIEMGELNEDSCNFPWASLELKSDSERMK